MLDARTIHACVNWRDTLSRLGVPAKYLTGKHGPCPRCGGKDRFRYTDYRGQGRFICNQCGTGDGFELLGLVHGWDFKTALREVQSSNRIEPDTPRKQSNGHRLESKARMPARCRDLFRTATSIEAVPDAVAYLRSRGLWPLRDRPRLFAHAAADYWQPHPDDGRPERVGKWPAIVAPVENRQGERVTCHMTWLEQGRKLDREGLPARKLLSRLVGHEGCAVRLFLIPENWDGTLGVTEGIEDALAAQLIHGGIVWACLNASLLAAFTPPEGTRRLLIFGDRDVAGLEATANLMERMQGRVHVENRTPPGHKDWADVIERRAGR